MSGIGELVWPIVVAHRGASAIVPENTIPAFRAAAAAGADVVEMDVRLTSDGVPVVLHDADVAATTDGRGLVHTLTLEQVRRLDASGERAIGEPIPTLAEALAALSGRAGVDIEIKNIPGDPGYDGGQERAAAQVVKLLDEVPFEGPVLISSFNPASIGRVRALAPRLATGLLTVWAFDPRSALALAREHGHVFLLPAVESVEEEGAGLVVECRAAGVRLGTWTVDDPDRIARLFALGVDAVVTNDPQGAVPVRDAARAGRQP